SGNHAQAVALAGRILAIPATIVMPADAPQVKVAATCGYGAEVVFYDRAAGESREAVAERVSREKGASVIPPFDHPLVIAGQGTAAKELIEETGALDYLFVCTGGAGLLSGSAVAARHLAPEIRVVAWSPPRATTRRARSARRRCSGWRTRSPSRTARARSRSARSPFRWCCATCSTSSRSPTRRSSRRCASCGSA